VVAAKHLPTAEQPLTVKIYSPAEVFYEGRAKSVSALNADGPFDVLDGHINFFSLLVAGTVVVDTGEESREIPISHGILHVRSDQVTLFVFGVASEE
jgi:F0F1-type ATP synthase epsilon subunit